MNLQFFPQRFFFFYILSYQLDSLTCTKNHLFITNHLNPPPRFFSHFGRGAYLVDIKLIISQFLPIFILINIRTRVPFKIISTPNNQSITKLPNLQKRVFPQKDKKNITYETIYTSSIYIQFLLFIPRKEIIQHAQRKKTSQLTLWQQKSLR